MKVKEVMTRECRWISPDTTVAEAAQIMRNRDIGFLPVGDEAQKKLIGTLTDRDIVIRCTAEGFNPTEHEVEHVMTKDVLYCFEDEEIEQVCQNMADVRVRRLPVMSRDKKLVGIVSFGDLSQAAKKEEIANTQQDLTRECAQNNQKAA